MSARISTRSAISRSATGSITGSSAAEAVTDWGLDKLGIEHAPPMISRGVLLDVAGLDGGQFLKPGRAVSPDDLARAAEMPAWRSRPATSC